jgi:hypothetical protein
LLYKNVLALDMQVDFCFLAALLFFELFNGQEDIDINHLVKVPRDAVQLGQHILSEGWGHFQVMSADLQIHRGLLTGAQTYGTSCESGLPVKAKAPIRLVNYARFKSLCQACSGAKNRCRFRAEAGFAKFCTEWAKTQTWGL